ncbi:Tuberous sclerosis 2-like protein [Podila epigama]|nr:Tuberous sclerosis 2-like protein [Podila epigama]
MSKSRPTSSKLNSFFKFRTSTKETSLYETLRLDSARPTDPIDANEIVQQLLPGVNTLQSRLRTLEELSDIVLSYPFQHISELWVAVEDLLEPGVPHNARKAAWNFMNTCIRGQFEDLGMLRAIFYQAINNHEIWEDFEDKLQALTLLTNNGRDVYGFEKNIVRLLAHWIASSFEQAKVTQHMSQQRHGMQKSTTSLVSISGSAPHLMLLQKPIPHFDTTMALLISVVKFNFVFFDELEIASLLDLLHTICINAPEDTSHIIGFLDVIVRYGYVPSEGLPTFLRILCYTTLSDSYQEQAWNITLNLMKSHSAHSAIRQLCMNLRSKNDGILLTPAHIRVIQGSIRLLQRSVWGASPIDTLSVAPSTVLWSLKSAIDFGSRDIDIDIIQSLSTLLSSHRTGLSDLEYEIILDILERLLDQLLKKSPEDHTSGKPFVFGAARRRDSTGPQHSPNAFRSAYGNLLFQIISLHSSGQLHGVTTRLMSLLAALQDHLPEEVMLLLLDYYRTEHQFYPYTVNWLERLHVLMKKSVIEDKRPLIRARALQIAVDVYETSLDLFHDDIVTRVFMDLFERLHVETDQGIASQLSRLLIQATRIASDDVFPMLLDKLVQCIRCPCNIPKAPQTSGSTHPPSLASRFGMSSSVSSNSHLPPQNSTPTPAIACQSLTAAIGIIELFQCALYDPSGASRVDDFFRLLVGLAINQDIQKASRLVLLDFLLCLRVDLDHRIFCTDPSTIESMAAATEQLLNEETRQDRGERTAGGAGLLRGTAVAAASPRQPPSTATSGQHSHPSLNWKPLMQGRTMQASPYVISYLEIAPTTDDSRQGDESLPAPLIGCAKLILNIPLYMTGILSILEQEKDFEIYSFVIQRLPSQLFNKHLFCNSPEQITKLHSVLVDMTLRDKIPDSLRNLPLNAKRHNIHILAYRVLVILLCYNSKFSTQELHDLVHAFVFGLQRQATCAKICIHALVVCCYELPQSMTKHLSATVLKLSQIMSTATISVHILEFLSTVARLPMLYSNFVESDYKRVFGIALKYIQYTHSVAGSVQPPSTSSAHSSVVNSPVTIAGSQVGQQQQASSTVGARALPQYVLIMAYQVIDVWFMLQRLPERRKYVPYIVRNLLMANEPGKKLDEQTETCLDMLARYSYANVEPKPRPSLIQQMLLNPGDKTGKVVTKTWLQGNSFITIRTARNVGWAEIIVRRASGTVNFLLKIENDMFMDNADDFDFTSLPSLLRLQEETLAQEVATTATGVSTVVTGTSPAPSTIATTTVEPGGLASLPMSTDRDSTGGDVEPSQDLMMEPQHRNEEVQHLAAFSGLTQRLGEGRPSWLSPRTTPQVTPHQTPLHSPLHTPRHTPHHTPRASPLPSGDNTPSSSPPSRSFMMPGSSRLAHESDRGGHQRVHTAPAEHVAVFSSPSLHPLQEQPAGSAMRNTGGEAVMMDQDRLVHSQAPLLAGPVPSPFSATGAVAPVAVPPPSTTSGVFAGTLGRSKSASEHASSSHKAGVKHAELSRGPLGGALEQTKSLLSQSVGNIKREDVRRSMSIASSRHNSITAAAGRAHRLALGYDDHRPPTGAGDGGSGANAGYYERENNSSFSKAKMETFVDPSFLFMQLTSNPDLVTRETPILLAEDDATNRALGVLDRTPVVDFHKIGVLYVGKGQSKEVEILGNTHGSAEYTQFLTGLGTLVRLKGAKIYAGGLDLEMDLDGEYAYSHQDEITQMIFHVATMIPNNPHDPQFNGKKRHIGNDWVTIVFNESGSDYDFGTISGQFNFMTVVVTPVSMASVSFTERSSRSSQQQPLDVGVGGQGDGMPPETSDNANATTSGMGTGASTGTIVKPFKNVWFKVVMLRRPDMPEIGPLATPKIVSVSELARFTRQMALHANIYAQVYYQHMQNSVEYVSNWQERLRQIKRMKERLTSNAGGSNGQGGGSTAGTGVSSNAATGGNGGGIGGSGGGGGGGSSSAATGSGSRGGTTGTSAGNSNSNSASGGSGQGGNTTSSGIGLGLGLGLGLVGGGSSGGQSTSGSSGGTTSGGANATGSSHQPVSIMSLEPVVDFTRYA